MKKLFAGILVFLLLAVVIGHFLYPVLSDQLGRRRDAEIMQGYREKTSAMSKEQREKLFAEAGEWNENLKNGEYWLKEVEASYGQALLTDPIPFAVVNPVKTQLKRVLAGPGERVVLSPYAETRVNGLLISTDYTSGRTEDAAPEGRRLIMARDRYFVQGDQLSLSVDSRETDYSTVSDGEILGRAEFALWPLQCFGNLTGRQTVVAGTETEAAE